MFIITIPSTHKHLASDLETVFEDGLREIAKTCPPEIFSLALPFFNLLNTSSYAVAKIGQYEPATHNQLNAELAAAVADLGTAIALSTRHPIEFSAVSVKIQALQKRIQDGVNATVSCPDTWKEVMQRDQG